MALKLVAYGCSPSAFMDYFQMSESTARQCILKFCRIISSHDELHSVYARKMMRSDARRLSALHEALHGVVGMIGSLDCMTLAGRTVQWRGRVPIPENQVSQRLSWKHWLITTCGSGIIHLDGPDL